MGEHTPRPWRYVQPSSRYHDIITEKVALIATLGIDEIPIELAGIQETISNLKAQLVPIKGPEQQGIELIISIKDK